MTTMANVYAIESLHIVTTISFLSLQEVLSQSDTGIGGHVDSVNLDDNVQQQGEAKADQPAENTESVSRLYLYLSFIVK